MSYARAMIFVATSAMRARIEAGEEFRVRQIWIVGNKAAGWPEFDDKSPCFQGAWTLIDEYRRKGVLKARKAGPSKVWRYVKR